MRKPAASRPRSWRSNDGEEVEARSRRGALRVTMEGSDRIRPGTVFLPMHWGASQGDLACEANRLMHALGCPLSRQPELKAAAVCLRPGGAGVCVSKAP